MTFSSTLFVILLMTCSLSPWGTTAAQEAKADAEGPLDTPVYGVNGAVSAVALPRLLAVPERFEGQQIRVCGFVLQHLDKGTLYASEADYEHGMMGNAIPLTFDRAGLPQTVNNRNLLSFGTVEAGYYYLLATVEQKDRVAKRSEWDEWSDAGFRLKVHRQAKPSFRPSDNLMQQYEQAEKLCERLSTEEGKKLMPDEHERMNLIGLLMQTQNTLQQAMRQAARKEPDLLSAGVERPRYGKEGKRVEPPRAEGSEPKRTLEDKGDPFSSQGSKDASKEGGKAANGGK